MRITYCGPFDAVEDPGLGVTLEQGDSVDVTDEQALARLAQRSNFEPGDAEAQKLAEALDAADAIRDALAAEPFDAEDVARTLDGFTKAQLEAYAAGVEVDVEDTALKADLIDRLVQGAARERGIDLVVLPELDTNDDQEG